MKKVLQVRLGSIRVAVGFGKLDGNHHGPRAAGKSTVLRLTSFVVPLGRDFYMKREGRLTFGRRLWLYGRSGACVNFDFIVRFDRSPCKPGTRYGPQDDGGVGMIML